ncbi:hypothetical protein A2U01_0031332 [Trifolium medium]|uniref:Uncharacterized protein n=1 Tax=Trifolium medium TaxID=97028 RepID=A0A392PFI8_9FABA|nr:hypothetical protein [Trifolium medium]
MWPLWNGGADIDVKWKPLLENGEDIVRRERVNLGMLGDDYKNGGYLES